MSISSHLGLDLNTATEYTGEFVLNIDDDNYSYMHLIISEEQYNSLIALGKNVTDLAKELNEDYEIDFISVRYENEINFIHVTSQSNFSFVEKNGIFTDKEWIHHLGKGIYAVEENDIQNKNFFNFVEKNISGLELTFVKGHYKGEYTKCIYGADHEGFIVLKTDKILKNELIIKQVKRSYLQEKDV